jgi:acyl-coenzyme A synthetase/AMP-(fatty) acid ligase
VAGDAGPAPAPLQVTDLVFDWAQRLPDKAAIVHEGRPLSYGALAHRIAQARSLFVRHGLTGAGVVAVAVANLQAFWILSLALRSLGVTTIAPRPGLPLEDLGLPDIRGVVSSPVERSATLDAACAAAGLPLLYAAIEAEAPFWPTQPAAAEATGGHILLTSGTTGLQKKVLMQPSFEPAYIRHRRGVMGISRDSVGVLFDFAAWTGAGYKGVVSSLTAGATVVIDQRPMRQAPLLYPGVTYAVIVPTMVGELLACPPDALPPNPALQIQVAAGALTLREVEALKARITPDLVNSFGSTETRPVAFTPMATAEDQRWHRLVPDRGVQVVDELDRPLPAGQIGRLRVTTTDGPTGYLHDETATRAFFKDGYFYPGDLAVIRADGRMALHGRVTDVINLKGRKILPAPIEERLREILAVSGVCLFSMQNPAGEEEIHVVLETQTPLDLARLQEGLSRELTGFSGAHVHYVPALARNAMGKVVRLAAREQALAAARARAQPATASPPRP